MLLRKASTIGAFTRAPQYADSLGSALTFDSSFNEADLQQLVTGFHPSPDAVDFYSLPGVADDYRGASYVFPKEPDADELLARLGGRPIPDTSLPFGR